MSRPSNDPRKLRILLVEDSEDILFILKVELEFLGYAVFTARDALSAIEAAKHARPDLIVSDIGLPGADGFELLRQLRRMAGLASVPAIALTGFGLAQEAASTLENGFSAHLTKPVEGRILSEQIQRLVGERRASAR